MILSYNCITWVKKYCFNNLLWLKIKTGQFLFHRYEAANEKKKKKSGIYI